MLPGPRWRVGWSWRLAATYPSSPTYLTMRPRSWVRSSGEYPGPSRHDRLPEDYVAQFAEHPLHQHVHVHVIPVTRTSRQTSTAIGSSRCWGAISPRSPSASGTTSQPAWPSSSGGHNCRSATRAAGRARHYVPWTLRGDHRPGDRAERLVVGWKDITPTRCPESTRRVVAPVRHRHPHHGDAAAHVRYGRRSHDPCGRIDRDRSRLPSSA